MSGSQLFTLNDGRAYDIFGSHGETEAGVTVNERVALQVSTIWACVWIISGAISVMPWQVYRKTQGRREHDPSNPVDRLLRRRPNDEMTDVDFKQLMSVHTLLWGRCFAEVVRDSTGRPTALWPIMPDRVQEDRDSKGRLIYNVWDATDPATGKPIMRKGRKRPDRFRAGDIFTVRGLSLDGLIGLPVIRYMRQAVGMALATEGYGARLFKNDSRPSGFLKHPEQLSLEAQQRLKDDWQAKQTGRNQHKVAILEEGMEFQPIAIPPEDAQFLQTRQHQVLEICRFFGVPPHMVADLSRATFSNIEHQSLAFVRQTLLTWMRKFESEADAKLLMPMETRGVQLYSEFDSDELSRADLRTRMESHQIALMNGIRNIDEVREYEGMSPLPDGEGQVHRVPLNTAPVGTAPDEPADTPDEPDEPDEGDRTAPPPANLRAVFAESVREVMSRLEEREVNAARAKRSDPANWAQKWFDDFRKPATESMATILQPLAAMRGATNPPAVALHVARQWYDGHAETRLDDLDGLARGAICTPAEAFDVVDTLLEACTESLTAA